MARHAVITFLESQEALGGIDTDFRKLVEVLHCIPFCASFGVSCSGHFNENDEHSDWSPNCFNPSPWGHLNIIVLSTMPHIQELLQLMGQVIGTTADTTFKKIQHVFGPPKTSKLEVWEIRIHDNGCLGDHTEEVLIRCTYFPKADNEQLYQSSKKRCDEIKLFWDNLAAQLTVFCREHGFNEEFALNERVKELLGSWE